MFDKILDIPLIWNTQQENTTYSKSIAIKLKNFLQDDTCSELTINNN